MSKEIDFSKAPEGATHYRETADNIDWYRKSHNEWQYWIAKSNSWHYGATWFRSALPVHPQWSIYTNDKPLCELSDEQAAALFNWWRNGGDVEYKGSLNDDWCCKPKSNNVINVSSAYRAKQKSERELFVEEIESVIGYTDLPTLKIGTELFDSGKFKLVEQSK